MDTKPATPEESVPKTNHTAAAHELGSCNGRCDHPLDCDHEPLPQHPLDFARRIQKLNTSFDQHNATLDRLDRGIDRVLAGSERRADTALLTAIKSAGAIACPSCGWDELDNLPAAKADPATGVMADHPGGLFCSVCCRWACVNETKAERADTRRG